MPSDTKGSCGLTHNFYRYPARFSPMFARGTIEAFSNPGDVIFDPFMGGATTLVEARVGRHAVGSDIRTLSVFLSRVKTTPLSENDIMNVVDWIWDLPEHLNLHLPPVRVEEWQNAGYQRHVPWPIRKSIELAIARIGELRTRQQRFARCILLRIGQWAWTAAEYIPSAAQFRNELIDCLDAFTKGMREFRDAVKEHPAPRRSSSITLSIHCPAAEIPDPCGRLNSLPKRPNLW